jgi:molybdopterin-synthase adenylyltransferase
MDASHDTPTVPPELARYSRQILLENIGVEGQRGLAESRVLLVGCGALGTVLASTLVRAGVGFIRLCDRDFIEPNNLQRQILFDEDDIAANLPKAEAATAKLAKINSDVTIEAVVDDVNVTNIARLADDVTLILDGTDNFETRYLINDYAVKNRKPWVYGAVIGTTGLCMAIIPHETPCLRCVFEDAPPPEMSPTCDTAGVLGPAVNLVASFQAVEAIKILTGQQDQINRSLMHIDAWTGRVSQMKVQSTLDKGHCPCCKRNEFPYLDGHLSSTTTTLCGRDAVQVQPGGALAVDFDAIAAKLEPLAADSIRFNRFMLRATVETCEFTLFPDGRAIIKGTSDPKRARSLYAKYIGA